MIGKRLLHLAAGFLLFIAVSGAQAASQALLPFTPGVKVGDVIAIGGFSDFSDQPASRGLFIVPDVLNTVVRINAVPVPASLWLLGSGVLGVAGIARRHRRNV